MKETRFGPVWFIPGKNRGRYPHCHSIYIEGPGILIDPASDRERLTLLKKDPGINEIWLSHWHEDHLLNLDLFRDIPLRIARPDAPQLADLELYMDAYGVPDQDREEWRRFYQAFDTLELRRADSYLPAGQTVSEGSVSVELIATPGHTPGHLSFFFEEIGLLAMGDYDLTPFGPWYGDVNSDIDETINSINRLKSVDADIRLTAHDKGIFHQPTEDIWAKYENVIYQREEKLLRLLKNPKKMEEIVAACIIYGKPREPKIFFEFGEQVLMQKHLERLIKKGRVVLENQRYESTS